jgi:hypothetical protein
MPSRLLCNDIPPHQPLSQGPRAVFETNEPIEKIDLALFLVAKSVT